ncbi:Hydrophobin-2 [Lactarius tabidus]
MMFYQPIVSLLAAFATASCASATPLLRRGDGGYPPTSSTSVSQCNTGTQQCCKSVNSSFVGFGCDPDILPSECAATPACCENVEQYGFVNLACTPITR